MLKKYRLILIALAAISIAGWYVQDIWYELYGNDLEFENAKRELVENFNENKAEFKELGELCRNFNTLELFQIEKNGLVSFRVEDSIEMATNVPVMENGYPLVDIWYTQIGAEAVYDNIQDFEFQDSSMVKVFVNGEWVLQRFNCLSFYGDRNDKLIPKLLAYNNLDLELAHKLLKLVQKVNCTGIDIEDGLALVLYRGAFFTASICYIIPLDNRPVSEEWIPLGNNIYWMYRDCSLWCSLTDWSY